jgi:predicted dehydrogenase
MPPSILRWALIGTGDIATRRIAPALRDLGNCRLVSVSRARSELADAFAKQFGVRKWFADWREQITDDEIDAVYVATPVYLHASQTIAAAEAGKHVLCEKPMAMSMKECDEMIAACGANNVKLGLAYYRRFYPNVIRTNEIIGSGEIGKVSIAQINAFEYFDPPAEHPRKWLLDNAKGGGGPMMDFGCHRIEVLLNLFGPIRQVEGVTSNSAFDREVEDTAAGLLRFETGCCATVTVTHAAVESKDTLNIYGTKGSIHIPVLNKGEMTVVVGDGTREEFHPTASNTHQPLINNFAEAVLNGRKPEVGGEIGRLVNSVIEQIYRNDGQYAANI